MTEQEIREVLTGIIVPPRPRVVDKVTALCLKLQAGESYDPQEAELAAKKDAIARMQASAAKLQAEVAALEKSKGGGK
jgi:uncharacterized protein YbjQ (UPF0145 family)